MHQTNTHTYTSILAHVHWMMEYGVESTVLSHTLRRQS
jgi:hypothetical protein